MIDMKFDLRKYVAERLYECSEYFEDNGNPEGAKEIKDFADHLEDC